MPRAAAKKANKTKTTQYDVAEHFLRTPEEMAAYLDAWLEEAPDDAAGIAGALGNIARAKGMTQVAKAGADTEGECPVWPKAAPWRVIISGFGTIAPKIRDIANMLFLRCDLDRHLP